MKQIQKPILFSLLLIYILLVCVLGTIGHNHEIDGSFHDNCPACQWEIQAQNEDTILSTIWDVIHNPFYDISQIQTNQVQPLVKQIFLSSISNRAPPLV